MKRTEWSLFHRVTLAAAFALAGILSLATVPGEAVAENGAGTAEATKPYFFIVMADPQLGYATKNKDFATEEANFRKAIAEANRLKPAFVVICGDMINLPDSAEQVEGFQRIVKDFSGEFPVYWASGNHDVSGSPTPETIAAYEEVFGPDRFTFDHAGDRFFFINSSIIFNSKGAPEEEREQFEWLKSELEKANADGVTYKFIVMHHPWFLESTDEEDTFYNAIRRAQREPYLELLREHNVEATFAGHTHFEAGGRDGDMEMITTSSICPPWTEGEEVGFRIVKVTNPEGIEHAFYPLDEMPEEVTLEH